MDSGTTQKMRNWVGSLEGDLRGASGLVEGGHLEVAGLGGSLRILQPDPRPLVVSAENADVGDGLEDGVQVGDGMERDGVLDPDAYGGGMVAGVEEGGLPR